jgi:hypothetical protein
VTIHDYTVFGKRPAFVAHTVLTCVRYFQNTTLEKKPRHLKRNWLYFKHENFTLSATLIEENRPWIEWIRHWSRIVTGIHIINCIIGSVASVT